MSKKTDKKKKEDAGIRLNEAELKNVQEKVANVNAAKVELANRIMAVEQVKSLVADKDNELRDLLGELSGKYGKGSFDINTGQFFVEETAE